MARLRRHTPERFRQGFCLPGARDSLAEAKDLVESALRGERVRSAVVDTNNVLPLPRLAATLEEAALHLEWASLRREWRRTQGMARKLVTTVDGIHRPLLSRIGGSL